MGFFTKKEREKREAVKEGREIPLGDVPEAGLALVYALLLGQKAAARGQLDKVLQPVSQGIRAELTRRWQNRGAPAVIHIPEKLPALTIEIAALVFQQLAAGLNLSADLALQAAAEPAVSDSLAGQQAAVKLADAIREAIERARVQIGATLAAS